MNDKLSCVSKVMEKFERAARDHYRAFAIASRFLLLFCIPVNKIPVLAALVGCSFKIYDANPGRKK